MHIETEKLFSLLPTAGNPRNSEGDFARLPDGSLMFAFSRFYGESWHDHAESHICAVYAPDGEHFDTDHVCTLLTPDRFGGDNMMCVTLRPAPDGGVRLYCLVKFGTKDEGPVRSAYYWIDSPDGKDFSGEPHLCFPMDGLGYHVVNNCRVETLRSGRIIIPAAAHAYRNEGGCLVDTDLAVSRFLYSDDGGRTFFENVQTLRFPDDANENGLQEPGVVELPDGRLYGYFRTDADCQYESCSADGGITWSAPKPSAFESAISPMKIARNPYSGKYYAIRNPYRERENDPMEESTWGRTPLAISESEDGVHFGAFALIESDARYGYCYPAIFFLSATKALVAYCSGGEGLVPLQSTTVKKIIFLA